MMPLSKPNTKIFRKSLLAMAVSAAVAPPSLALDLTQAPPGTVEPYVRPNVIISVDDSGSMDYRIDQENAKGATNNTTPADDETWPATSRRMNVLKYALKKVFNDTTLLPEGKIRLAWQAMWGNGNSGDEKNVNSSTLKVNSMRPLSNAHKSNFLKFVNALDANNTTPTHAMLKQADEYLRRPLSAQGPWANNPGVAGPPYLACRRNYHIVMTDGRWNGAVSGGSRDDNTNLTLPDGAVYGGPTVADRAKTALYRDTFADTLADWAFYSWSNPLQTTGLSGTMQPATDYRKAPAEEFFGNDSAGKPAKLERYWNPKYNPATWAHLVTYTIGFSNSAITWPGWTDIVAPTEKVPFGYNGSFPDLVTGNRSWPVMSAENRRALDLWHAALNGRGRFYAVSKGEDLEKAFREIIGTISTQNEPNLTSNATSGSNTSRSDVGKFTASYEPDNAWKGSVVSELVKTDGTTVPNPAWDNKNTADRLDELTSVNARLILSWSDKWETSDYKGGVSFKWASDESRLSTAQKMWLRMRPDGSNADDGATLGQQRLDYVRGDRSLEGVDPDGYTSAKPFRERKSRQGDVINSVVWYTGAPISNYARAGYSSFTRNHQGRPAMLYVGGNDGMLHGFAAADGREKMAYVPRGAIPALNRLTAPAYNDQHRYFVDGSPMTGDVDMGSGIQDEDSPSYTDTYTPDWRTVLVGTMGAGGKGYFVLDVTNPTSTVADGKPAFAEANASQLVILDRTRSSLEPTSNCVPLSGAEKAKCEDTAIEDKDIGNITAQVVLDENNPLRSAQITRMNNNRWAVILGNGYNSTNQRAVLLVQYLDGAKELLRISTTVDAPGTGLANDNGLAAPRPIDLNGDGRIDIVYAGDNLGNMWKFDLTGSASGDWSVAFSGKPLFTAQGPAALASSARTKPQPITAPPTARANDRMMAVGTGASATMKAVGGMMVAFGTGRNLTKTDTESVDVQSLYSVLDNTRYRYRNTSLGRRLEVHPGGGTCPDGDDCVPEPKRVGTIGASSDSVSAELAHQKITELSGGYGTVDAVDELNAETWSSFTGWYLDLPSIGERLLKPMEFFDGSNLLTVYSQVPAKGSKVDPNIESCESTSVDKERQYRTLVNIMDGKRPSVQLVNANGDNEFDFAGDKGASRTSVTEGSHTMITHGKKMLDVDVKNKKEELARMPEESLRPSWRQLK